MGATLLPSTIILTMTIMPLRFFFLILLPSHIHVNAIMIQQFSYIVKREVLQHVCSKSNPPPLFTSLRCFFYFTTQSYLC